MSGRVEQPGPNVTLYLGNCLDLIKEIPRCDAVVSDPPYGISYVHSGACGKNGVSLTPGTFKDVKIAGDDKPFDPAPFLKCAPQAILWGGNHYADKLPPSAFWLVWDKRAASKHSNDFADCELAWSNIKKPARMFRHQWDGMMKASEKGIARVHPTQKPVALMKWCLTFLAPRARVVDPFMGLGHHGRCMRGDGSPVYRNRA